MPKISQKLEKKVRTNIGELRENEDQRKVREALGTLETDEGATLLETIGFARALVERFDIEPYSDFSSK